MESMIFTMSDYQRMARRTQNADLAPDYRVEHATWGLAAEVGEVLGLHQKTRQGHELRIERVADELGDVLWFVAELCDCYGLDMGQVAGANINKLRERYPQGFEAERSRSRYE